MEDRIKQEFNIKSIDELYELLGSGNITAVAVLKKIYPEYN